jgi:hypothetical protein
MMSTNIRKVSKYGSLHVAEARIRNMLKWSGMSWDEGPGSIYHIKHQTEMGEHGPYI